MNKEFLCEFQITKMIIFEVGYYTLAKNKSAHFNTFVTEFNQSKTDWSRIGQIQKDLLKDGREARKFYEKWNVKHLHDLTESEYNEMLLDLEVLKEKYNFIEMDLSKKEKPYIPNFNFYELKKLSMQKIKKINTVK